MVGGTLKEGIKQQRRIQGAGEGCSIAPHNFLGNAPYPEFEKRRKTGIKGGELAKMFFFYILCGGRGGKFDYSIPRLVLPPPKKTDAPSDF